MKQTAFSAWERARQDIFKSWMHETDAANLQPRVGKFNRELAQFLRDFPPAEVPQSRLERALDAIESPCSRRDELALRDVYSRELDSNEAKSKGIVEEVERLGLEPFQAPPPLPPISPTEIHLICWMAIERSSGD